VAGSFIPKIYSREGEGGLFPDTEARKYFSEQIIAGELAGDLRQLLLREA
jgi:hypothetical protein